MSESLSLGKRFNPDKSMVSRGKAKLMKHHKIRKGARSFGNLAPFLAPIRPVDTYKGVFGTPIGIRTQTVRTGI